jgi:hypothetical protein
MFPLIKTDLKFGLLGESRLYFMNILDTQKESIMRLGRHHRNLLGYIFRIPGRRKTYVVSSHEVSAGMDNFYARECTSEGTVKPNGEWILGSPPVVNHDPFDLTYHGRLWELHSMSRDLLLGILIRRDDVSFLTVADLSEAYAIVDHETDHA